MIITVKINKDTLQCITDDDLVVVNYINETDNEIELQLSKPDPEPEQPWQQ